MGEDRAVDHSERPSHEPPAVPRSGIRSRTRLAVRASLVLAFFGSIVWIFLGRDGPPLLLVGLVVVAAASLVTYLGWFMREDLPLQWRRAIGAGVALVGLIGTVLAVLQQGDSAP